MDGHDDVVAMADHVVASPRDGGWAELLDLVRGVRRSALVELERVVAEDEARRLVVELLELVRVVERLRHALDVGPVGAEDHPIGAHEVDDLVRVVLPERVDPHVLAERSRRGRP